MYGSRQANPHRAKLAKFPSFVGDKGITRYTVPITTPGSYPPEVTQESRSMEHWLQDYPYLEERTSLGGDY